MNALVFLPSRKIVETPADAGLVVDTAVGTRRVYRVDPDGVDELRAYLDGFWNRALRAFKEVAEHPTKEDS